MLLRALKEFHEREADELPPLYARTPIRYIIQLESHGTPLGRRPIDTADPTSPQARRGQRYPAPQIVRSSGIKPFLLADKADYVLGFIPEGGKAARVAATHQAFVAIVDRCAQETGSADVRAVATFLKSDPLGALELPPDFDPSATVTFTVDGRRPVDEPAVQRFWAALHDAGSRGGPTMQCIVCGEMRPVVARLPGKIKNIPGGQTSGTALISANAPAFESYGLKASLVAPTCSSCAEGFSRGLNSLLGAQESRVIIGPSVFVFWTRRPSSFRFRDTAVDARPEAVQDLLESVNTGTRPSEVDENDFYAATLSGSGGRAVVRDWIDTTVGRGKENVARWYRRQEIADPWAAGFRPFGLYALAMTTVREPRDLSPTTLRILLRGVLTGAPLPLTLLGQAVQRCRADQKVDRPHAAMIKLVLLSQSHVEGDSMVALREDHPSVAYQCGRLLAVLESAQRAALGDVGASIIDRFYGTASSAPLTVFPRLLRGVQPHLGKLQRDRPAAWHAIQDRLAGVLGMIDPDVGFPATLRLSDQGLFALGYYHQRAMDRTQARAAADRKRASNLTTEAESSVDEGVADVGA